MQERPEARSGQKEMLTKPAAIYPDFSGPLRSQQRTQHLLPRSLSSLDLVAILVLLILFVPNVSVVQILRITGPTIYLYWISSFVLFLAPCALIVAQLNCLIPAEASIYVWTHRALGSIWGFFAGFCAWIPAILWTPALGAAALLALQNLGQLLFGPNTHWLTQPWQQGLFIIGALLLTGLCSNLPLTTVLKGTRWIAGLQLASILITALGGLIWLAKGHPSQLTAGLGTSGLESIGIFGFVNVALLGLEVPFHMTDEMRKPEKARKALGWSTLLICVFYLLATFGITTVLPLTTSVSNYSFLGAVYSSFGTPMTVLVSSIFFLSSLFAMIVYNVTFSRILFAAALDQRLPASLTQVNRYGAAFKATNFQIGCEIALVAIIYLIIPFFYNKSDFSTRASDLLLATSTIFWFISTLFLFCDLPVLLHRYRSLLRQGNWKLLLPPWLLWSICALGVCATLLSIFVAFSIPIDTLFTPMQWQISIGIAMLAICLAGFLGAAYPRLLSNVQEQTAMARENARLYAELREAYEKLAELDQHKDAFLATASHELRTPLTIVQGYVELLAELDEDKLDAETRQTFIRRIRQGCDELALLLANIMDASTLQREIITLNLTKIHLRKAVIFVIELFDSTVSLQRRRIGIDIAEDVCIHADEIRLKQILRNLLANALRYTSASSPIYIKATIDQERNAVRVSVIDAGPGIPKDQQSTIFDKFVRLERDMHGDTRGSGLGLAICRQLVEAMHGTIQLESSGIEGEGCTFTFTLPRACP